MYERILLVAIIWLYTKIYCKPNNNATSTSSDGATRMNYYQRLCYCLHYLDNHWVM